ncbi:MAG: DUF438 domain-containing protein [Chloroflexi bacterium]|nr:DUF438 domain-containing protein [Chloroflexota bacterium]
MSEFINNGAKRKEVVKKMILDLHSGAEVEDVRERFRRLVGDVSAVEIARIEQELISEGLPAEDVKALCDVHVSVFQDSLDGQASPEMTPGHPVHTWKYENFAAGEVLKLLAEAIAELPEAEAMERARAHAGQLDEIVKAYNRLENLLFPVLERHGVSGPSQVMWSIHDEVRRGLKALHGALETGDAGAIRTAFEPLKTKIEGLFYKQEQIMFPTALKVLSDAEWVSIRDQSDEFGYCLVRPGDQWQPVGVEPAALPASPYVAAGSALTLDTGALTHEQINLLLGALPVDVTYVDENDTVRYYSHGPDRVFARTPQIIGRNVQNCHPPASVHVVNKLIAEMRAGQRNLAEFWIPMGGRFVYIRYVAVRSADGQYKGVVETTQDLTALRALQGERRLLDEA